MNLSNTCIYGLPSSHYWFVAMSLQFNLSDFTRRAYGTNYIETTRVQIHANCRIRRVYFSDRLYSEDELPAEFKLFLPVSKSAKKWYRWTLHSRCMFAFRIGVFRWELWVFHLEPKTLTIALYQFVNNNYDVTSSCRITCACSLPEATIAVDVFHWALVMFKNTFQSGFLSILYSIGSKPLQIWDKKVQ